jgi:ABC-2 type transport system permease protein
MNLFVSPTVTLWRREVVRFFRQRDRVIGAFATPLMFWAVIGSGFGQSFRYSTSYLDYLYPGTIVLSVLFTAIFSNISIIEDRREGFLQSVLVAPVARSSIVLGKTLGSTSVAMIQGVLFLFLAPLLRIPLSVSGFVVSVMLLLAISLGLSNLGFVFAWRANSTQGFHAIMNMLLMPMWLLSGAVFPEESAPAWMHWVMVFNPLTYGLRPLREVMLTGTVVSVSSVWITILFALVSFVLAALTASQRSEKNLT